MSNKTQTWPTEIDRTTNKPISSFFNDFYKAATSDYSPPNDGLKRVGSAFPDANRSKCKGVTKSSNDFMTVNFAGYVFEFPCTVKPTGSYKVGYNPDDSINFQEYSLYFGVNLGQKNYDGIWWQGDFKDRGTIGFHVNLHSNGLPVSRDPIKKWLDNAEQINDIPKQNLIIFYNKDRRRVRGFIKNKFENDEYISISCDLYGNPDPHEIFMPLHNIGDKSICNAYWSLTDTIKVRLLNIKSKNAYHFDLFYKAINKGLKEAIIKIPEVTINQPTTHEINSGEDGVSTSIRE
ncbi:hypothetical protein [Marinicella gelatinilytica]|uniref:hypothetical protein n=1 Tax=Marinicella gelatinilytica TaxID=2996017 RepID=UPI002260A643|nr:hypothetical protein [Marinicella gelatinilytica]MCX7545421.1 hypothetical protein [Marinicella gelatinilytica]